MAVISIIIACIFLASLQAHKKGKDKIKYDKFYVFEPLCGVFQTSPTPCPSPPVSSDLQLEPNHDMIGFLSVDSETNYVRWEMYGTGFPQKGKATSWLITVGSFPPESHPISQYIKPALPFAPTTASYSSGRSDIEANSITIDENGYAEYETIIDFNPLEPFQSPMVNVLTNVNQQNYPPTIGNVSAGDFIYDNLQQNMYQSSGVYQPIGLEFIREFNADGSQKLDENGLPVLARLPFAVPIIGTVAIHLDGLSHGMGSTIFINPFNPDPSSGDHYQGGFFRTDQKQEITEKQYKKMKKDSIKQFKKESGTPTIPDYHS